MPYCRGAAGVKNAGWALDARVAPGLIESLNTASSMVRLKDIASRAGVSVMTVSKALRDAPDISRATKTRVRKLADAMGYVPDAMAQGLRTRTTRLLGLVISATSDPIFARVLMAIEERAFEAGYDVLLAHSLNDPDREAAILRRLLARRVDGLLVAPVYRFEPAAPIYDELARRQTPTVVLGPPASFCSAFVSVAPDDSAGSRAAARHLLELGHRRIAFLAGASASPISRARLSGYRQALRDFGVEPDDRLVFAAGTTVEEGERAVLQLIEEGPRVTAVQAVNDLVAIGAANILLNRGVQVPDQISVAGFGNVLLSEYFRVPLTTVRQPKFGLGQAAMDLLFRQLRGLTAVSARLPASLVLRSSTAPAPTGPLAKL